MTPDSKQQGHEDSGTGRAELAATLSVSSWLPHNAFGKRW